MEENRIRCWQLLKWWQYGRCYILFVLTFLCNLNFSQNRFFLRKRGGWCWSGFAHLVQLSEHLFLADMSGSGDCCPGGPANPASPRFRQIDGASGNSSPHTKMQFKIVTASAPGSASLPTPRRLSSLGGGGPGTPAPGAHCPLQSRG